MTNESSNDSPRHGSGVSPRRAARAAREEAERNHGTARVPEQDALRPRAAEPDPDPGPETGDSAATPSLDAAAKTAGELRAEAATDQTRSAEKEARTAAEDARILAAGERAKAVGDAQRARTQSALRAREEAIEAQRAAAERVRQTLRANAAPQRDRSPSARSALTPDSPPAARQARDGYVVAAGRNTPFDQDSGRRPGAEGSGSADPAAIPSGPPTAPPPPSAPPVVKAQAQETGQRSKPPAAAAAAASQAAPAFGHSPDALPAPQGPAASPEQETPHPAGETEHFPDHAHEGIAGEPKEPAGTRPAHPHEPYARENLFLTSGASDPQVRKARRRRRNAIVAAVLLVFCAAIFGVVIFLQGLMDRLSPQDFPAPGGEAVTFEVEPGWGAQQIAQELESRDIVASDKLFLEAIRSVESENREIHPGSYELRREMPALDAAGILIGEPAAKVSYVAIKQNTRITQVLEDISSATGLSANELGALAEDPAAFGITTKAPNLEGYLHPGEYRFPLDIDAKTVLKTMVDATTKTLTDNGITDADRQYHVLQVASILQAEARPNDYGTVAGALENRLHPSNTETNGLLQVDSAVIYGLDRYTLQISESEKTDAGNPYNTYVHKGLPPTPIGSPGDSAIQAAAHPTPNDYFYWVTVDTNTGETKFARTYAEHRVNQNEFRAWCAANTDVCK